MSVCILSNPSGWCSRGRVASTPFAICVTPCNRRFTRLQGNSISTQGRERERDRDRLRVLCRIAIFQRIDHRIEKLRFWSMVFFFAVRLNGRLIVEDGGKVDAEGEQAWIIGFLAGFRGPGEAIRGKGRRSLLVRSYSVLAGPEK